MANAPDSIYFCDNTEEAMAMATYTLRSSTVPATETSAWALVDSMGRLLEVSPTFATTFEREAAALRGQLIHAYLHPDQVGFACQVSALVRDGLANVDRAWLVQMPSGGFKGVHAEIVQETHPTAGACLRIELEALACQPN